MDIRKRVSIQHVDLVFMLIPILIGSYLRISYTLQADFPINDGGLFYKMTEDLINNQFRLPIYTTYNQAAIPFAYPWGAFYCLGILNQVLKIPLLPLFRFFPLFFSILSLILIYPIAYQILRSTRQAFFASSVFAMIQPSYEWFLMGGGVTRSPAFFFSLIAILATLLYFTQKQRLGFLILSVVSSSLTAAFHLEIAWISALIISLIAFYYRRSLAALRYLTIHAVLGLILLSPYWVTIISNFGFSIFASAFQTGYVNQFISLYYLALPIFTKEVEFPILAALGFLGGFACLTTGKTLPLIWILVLMIFNPRSLMRSASLPDAMLIAISLDVLVLDGLKRSVQQRVILSQKIQNMHRAIPYLAVFCILFYAFIMLSFQQMDNEDKALSQDEQAAFSWIRENTPDEARFLVIPGNQYWEWDWISEWFPTLTGRFSILTVQGNEWKGALFKQMDKRVNSFTSCFPLDESCILDWFDQFQPEYDYILIPKRTSLAGAVQFENSEIMSSCVSVFENKDTAIYSCK